MERCFVLVVLLATFVSFLRAQDNTTTTLEEIFLDQYGESIQQVLLRAWEHLASLVDEGTKEHVEHFTGKLKWLPFTVEIINYLLAMIFNVMSEFGSSLGNVTLHSITQNLNRHCAEYLETPIEDLTVVPSNVSCVFLSLRSRLSLMLKMAIELGVKKLSRDCSQQLLPLCKVVPANCTMAYQERIGKLLLTHFEDNTLFVYRNSWTPLNVIKYYVTRSVVLLSPPYSTAYGPISILTFHISAAPSIEPFAYVNLIRPTSREELVEAFYKNYSTTLTEEQLTWGIVRSRAGGKDHICQHYKDIFPSGSKEYLNFFYRCNDVAIFQTTFDLLRCAYTDPISKPLTWSTVHSAYFHSQCLCLAFQGTRCGVRPSQGVDPHLYCLSMLLRDFQRQVYYRPAVTYFDYAFKTRVPICKFANFIQIGFRETCESSGARPSFLVIQSVQCYFQNLVDKRLNCSESLQVNTYNASVLCALQLFMQYVFCDDDDDLGASVRYYAPGDSPLVHILTFLDVSVRVLTLTTYLACPQLRNLPGKLLIGYQVTALLRLVMVRASLGDLALAVRLDVASDLASTLWLTAYLHFLTSSIRKLRLPDSLTTGEALVVLLRYSLFGWVLPVALSAAFFFMDEVLDSRVQFGQLLFVMCNYVALVGNVCMFLYNSHFYYDVRSSAFALQRGVKVCSVLADLFNFALKTSVLSGAGIIFRLVFTQIQGVEDLLGYYHALGTLQGLLLFLLYGCNREARHFLRGAWSRTLSRCQRRQNISTTSTGLK